MLDEQQRHAGVAQASRSARQRGAFAGIEPGRGFVDEQQPRIGGRRASEFDAAPVAEREILRERRGERLEAEARERCARAFGRRALRTARRRQREEIAGE